MKKRKERKNEKWKKENWQEKKSNSTKKVLLEYNEMKQSKRNMSFSSRKSSTTARNWYLQKSLHTGATI